MSLSSPCVNSFADCDVESNLRSGLRRRQTASQESMSWPRSQLRPVRRQHDCRYAGVDTIHSTPHDPLNESVALWFDDSSKVLCMRPLLKCDGECLLLTTGLCCDALTDSSQDGARQSLNLTASKDRLLLCCGVHYEQSGQDWWREPRVFGQQGHPSVSRSLFPFLFIVILVLSFIVTRQLKWKRQFNRRPIACRLAAARPRMPALAATHQGLLASVAASIPCSLNALLLLIQ